MAAIHGYSGEFSSDEDVDRMEQKNERFAKLDAAKPTKQQLDSAIETIKHLTESQDIAMSDDVLASLLDHFRIQRGPIVDSTRNLYKKIIIKAIKAAEPKKTTNGDANMTDNSNNNNNSNMVASKQTSTEAKQIVEIPSSDEDEPMPPQDQINSKKKLDAGVLEPMDVEADVGPIRTTKQIEISSSENSDSETEESSEEKSSEDSEQLDVTPIKPTNPGQQQAPKNSTPVVPKSVDVSKRAATSAASSAASKKYYTRSQRVVATRVSTAGDKKMEDLSKATSTDLFAATGKSTQTSHRSIIKYTTMAFVVAIVAFLMFYFRSDVTKLSDRVFKKSTINF